MTIRVVHDREHPYLIVNTSFLRDKSLSLKAKGFLAYLLHLPSDWQPYGDQLARELGVNKNTIGSYFRELIANGYCIREHRRQQHKRFDGYDYTIYEVKDSADLNNRDMEKGDTENAEVLSTNKRQSKNKKRSSEPSAHTTTPENLVFAESPLGRRKAAAPRAARAVRGAAVSPSRFPSDLTPEQVKFCLKFKALWEENHQAKYGKRDWKAVELITDLSKASAYLPPFFRDAVCDDYMAGSDHSLTVFCNNIGIIAANFFGTREYHKEAAASAARAAAENSARIEAATKALAAAIERNPDDPKWLKSEPTDLLDACHYMKDPRVGNALCRAHRDHITYREAFQRGESAS